MHTSKNPRSVGRTPAWLSVALQERGIRRYGAGQCNPRIAEYNNCTQLAGYDDKIAWCSSFLNWCMKQSGIRGTGSALARSWLTWGQPLEKPKYGCVAVLTADDEVDWKGHVGLFLRIDDENVYLFGGNQLEEVRELDYPRDRVLAYRWP
ncbi:TIGR02594 family protein [Paraburkholderia phenoliruptrix]|uniref:TIGR02594 family protein n=1 Tax=Paraburkholderia phenoliruptrix TaxID=252970 RepID=UPI0001C02E24|nr:TIGR02594 family protein [Paraburkholderia phenoliruptrix]WMY11730.1 TIGR02594 family protein [Paraburkholderia phenoliruptrix]